MILELEGSTEKGTQRNTRRNAAILGWSPNIPACEDGAIGTNGFGQQIGQEWSDGIARDEVNGLRRFVRITRKSEVSLDLCISRSSLQEEILNQLR